MPTPAGPGAHLMSVGARKYVIGSPSEFLLKEGLLSQNQAKVTNCASGSPAFTIMDKKVLADEAERGLYMVTGAFMSLHARLFISDFQTKTPVVTMKKKGMTTLKGITTMLVYRGGAGAGGAYLQVKGNLKLKDYVITEVLESGKPGKHVAKVQQKSTHRVIMEQTSYVILVEAGFDAALMCSLAMALDDQFTSEPKG